MFFTFRCCREGEGRKRGGRVRVGVRMRVGGVKNAEALTDGMQVGHPHTLTAPAAPHQQGEQDDDSLLLQPRQVQGQRQAVHVGAKHLEGREGERKWVGWRL
jgi:hypothetical protein